MTTMLTNADLTRTRPCDPAVQAAGLERTRFFPRQLVGPDDLTQDQIYFREKLRRHNRMLHGWGIVCGACVRRGATPCEVIIEPGYILGPWGDEIVIEREITIDLCKQGAGEMSGCCGDSSDPWCGDTRSDCGEGPLYIAVRYAECQARPVRGSGGCGCGCDDSACEYSRIRDSYAIKVLRTLPSTYTTPMAQPGATALVPCAGGQVARRCTPCPPEPWVILADVLVSSNCNVRAVDCFAHRRYVVSFADFYLTCNQSPNNPTTPAGAVNAAAVFTRAMSSITRSGDLMDVNAAFTSEPPRATITLARADGTPVTVPANFTVVHGETVSDLLAREGGRTLYDPVADQTVTLRSLYDNAAVPSGTRLTGVTSALALLEGHAYGVAAAPNATAPNATTTTDAKTKRKR